MLSYSFRQALPWVLASGPAFGVLFRVLGFIVLLALLIWCMHVEQPDSKGCRRRRTAVVGSAKGHSPAPAGTGKMRRFRPFA
jgi:hypothetical protein